MATIIRESIRFATTGTRLAMPVMTTSRIPIALGTRAFVPPLSVSLFHKNKGSIRPFATETEKEKPESGNSSGLFRLALIAAVTGIVGTLYIFSQDGKATEVAVKKPLNYQEVYNAIANLLESNPEYDDGSYGPVLLRLAWHAAGTYDKATNTGGSNGATMRFNPESHHAANSGLATARDLLEKVKKQYPDITYSDLWSLGGVVAVQEMGGPIIKWRPGRADAVGEQSCSPDGRLPDGAQGQDHLRNVFYRMGFNDQEIVALAGAHALGRCHTDRSGFEGPWTRSPTVFTNDYFKRLLEEKWVEKKWTGPKQFVDKATSQLMMLPADMSLTRDKAFKKYVDLYASNEKKFFDDFASAFQKLEELGVPFKIDTPTMTFKPTA